MGPEKSESYRLSKIMINHIKLPFVTNVEGVADSHYMAVLQ